MDNGGMRIAVFLLLGVAGITALSTLVGSGDPPEASALEQDEPLSIEEIPSHAERLAGAPVPPSSSSSSRTTRSRCRGHGPR